MKKLLAILISVVGLNVYAGLNLTNATAWYLAVKCFPSGNLMNGIDGNDTFSCSDTDTVMYVGRTGMSTSTTTADLDKITNFIASNSSSVTGYNEMGDGHVWLIPIGTAGRSNDCTVEGDPRNTIAVLYGFLNIDYLTSR